MNNRDAARALFGVAALLESEGANRYRVRAYRRAAVGFLALPHEATAHLDEAGKLRLPWLGKRLQAKLGELLTAGHMQFYDDFMAALPPAKRELLAIPGVGPKTADRLNAELHVQDLNAVIQAAASGKLRHMRGIGVVRERQIGEAATRLLREVA